jgi:Uma2 family endonuclease
MSHETTTEPLRFDTFEAYLDWEERQPQRYELHDGYVVLMTGGTDDHNAIADTVSFLLRVHFGGVRSRCRVYRADMRLRVGGVDSRYPDVCVRCPAAPSQALFHDDPYLIVEVISPTSAGKDLISTLPEYTSRPSLQQYVIIDSRKRAAWSHLRQADGRFVLVPAENERVEIPSENLMLSFEDVYAGTALDPTMPRP